MLRNLAGRLAASRCGLQRALSTATRAAAAPLQLAADRGELLDYFPRFVEDVKEAARVVGIPEETEWLARVAEHNVPHGKLLRASAALNACRLLAPASGDLAKTLAWFMELLQGAYCILDDICDGDTVRRGRPCWHMLVGMGAINDSHLLEKAIYQVLRRRFRGEPCYLHLLELFCDTSFLTGLGQNHDMHGQRAGATRFNDFSMERHISVARYKTAYYSFYTPTAAAMYLGGISDPLHHQVVLDITSDIGVLFTVQDDFLDCYASIEKTGKAANHGDIRNGKCTWLVAEAKQRADAGQLAVLKEHYGRDDPQSVAAVLAVFEQLGVREAALRRQRDALASLEGRIASQRSVPADALRYVLDSIRHHVPVGEAECLAK